MGLGEMGVGKQEYCVDNIQSGSLEGWEHLLCK